MTRQWKTTCVDIVALFLAFGLFNLSKIPFSCASSLDTNSLPTSSEEEVSSTDAAATGNKLLVIMLDGFRWDYYELQKNELRGFPQFLQEGVQAQWVDPVFPSESYPGWTTISTGLYPESHGILGNRMFDLKNNVMFDLNNETSTKMLHWWQEAEPIWTTATRNNKKSYLRLWSRCDVPFDEIIPDKCTGYREARGVQVIRHTLDLAIDHLLKDYQLAMVYGEHLDNIGHEYGPYSEELKQAMREVDDIIYDFLDRLTDTGLDEKVNVIIVSDHGMTWIGEGSGTVYIPVGDFLSSRDVYKAVGYGAMMSIAPYGTTLEKLYKNLTGRRGFDAYKREQIPDEFKYKNHRLVQDIVLVARPHNYLLKLPDPRNPFQQRNIGEGTHGYTNMTDMRTIFFARGPDFKKGVVHPPIHLVDEYQLFAHLLHLKAQPNNGTWAKVAGMLVSRAQISVKPHLFLVVPLLLFIHIYQHIF